MILSAPDGISIRYGGRKPPEVRLEEADRTEQAWAGGGRMKNGQFFYRRAVRHPKSLMASFSSHNHLKVRQRKMTVIT